MKNFKTQKLEKSKTSIKKIIGIDLTKANNTRGITLIALVVTIIVLLILAGVSLNAIVGDNGIITNAQRAKEKHIYASEREFLEQKIVYYQAREINKSEMSKLIGRKLSKKDAMNPDWYMIKIGENVYADGWYLVEKGLKVDEYGEIINN